MVITEPFIFLIGLFSTIALIVYYKVVFPRKVVLQNLESQKNLCERMIDRVEERMVYHTSLGNVRDRAELQRVLIILHTELSLVCSEIKLVREKRIRRD